MYNQGKYDNEPVTKGELKEVQKTIPTKDEYSKNYGSTPNPPYYVDSTWTDNGKLYRCIKERLFGAFNMSDWILVATDDSTIEEFVENVYTAYELPIPEQVDNKIETYCQDEDPSLNWNIDIDKEIHKGDYWYSKSTGIQKKYTKVSVKPVSYEWLRVSIPMSLFDLIDGHKNIYINKPTEYEKDDYWIIDTNEDIPENCSIGDIVVANVSSTTYDKNNFEKKDLKTIKVTAPEDEYYSKEEVDIKNTELKSETNAEIKKTKDEINLDVSTNVKPVIITKEQVNNYICLENTPLSQGAVHILSIKGVPGVTKTYTILTSNYEDFSIYDEISFDSPIILTATTIDDEVISDEIYIEDNYLKIIQRIDYDELNNKIVLENPIIHNIGDVLLNTYTDNTYIKMKDFDINLSFFCEYIKKNLLTDLFSTQVEARASWNISDQNIKSKVSRGNIISEINQSPELVGIKADKIKFEGLVTANEYFKVLEDGSIVAVNASLTGNIYLPDGGKVVGGDGLFTNLQFLSDGYQAFNRFGWTLDSYGDSEKIRLKIYAYIPKNFKVENAFLTFYHMPIRYLHPSDNNQYLWCYVKNINLYKVTNINDLFVTYSGYAVSTDGQMQTENTNKLNYTPAVNDTTHGVVSITSEDLKEFIESGINEFSIETSDTSPSNPGNDYCGKEDASSGYGFAILNIFGYMKTN